MLSGASGPIQKAGGGGCLAEEGAVPYKKGGVATPNPPPPGSASGLRLKRLMRFIRLGAREKICPGPGLALVA